MVSVVIPNYNGMHYLKGCLDSLQRQDYRNFEVILIDNYSQDSNYKWVKEAYPKIIFKRLNKNYGFSRAVNEGIQLAKGEYVLLLNNDTELEKDFLSQMVKAIQKDKRIFGVSSLMLSYHDRQIIDDAGDDYTILGWAYKRGDGKPKQTYSKIETVFSACAGAALYRKSAFKKIGLFDEQFFAYMEDVDISYRARIFGYYNVYCPKAKVYHIGSATSGSKYNAFKVKLAARNNVYVPYKNMPTLQLLLNLPMLILGTAIKQLWFYKKGYGKEYFYGLLEGLKTVCYIKKVPFKWRYLNNYIHIEVLLIKNTIRYCKDKLMNN